MRTELLTATLIATAVLASGCISNGQEFEDVRYDELAENLEEYQGAEIAAYGSVTPFEEPVRAGEDEHEYQYGVTVIAESDIPGREILVRTESGDELSGDDFIRFNGIYEDQYTTTFISTETQLLVKLTEFETIDNPEEELTGNEGLKVEK